MARPMVQLRRDAEHSDQPGCLGRHPVYFCAGMNRRRDLNKGCPAPRRGRDATSSLFLFTTLGETDLRWWLCATSGNGAVHEAEQLRHVLDRRRRVRIDTDYEVVRLTRRQEQGG